MFNFDKITFEVPCPSGEFPNVVTMREARFGLKFLCRGCKRDIQLVPKDGGATQAKRILDNFASEFPKTINIKI